MNDKEAMAYLQSRQSFGCKPGLDRIKKLLESMGNPQKFLKCIHVAGTNGKGSTVSMIAGILAESGYKAGVYTSPYIHRFSERIRINDAEISAEKIAEIIGVLKEKTEQEPFFTQDPLTEFEIITAMAFQYFKEQGCDVVVLETGLGGRLDATNAIDSPEAAVITTINYDHTDILGKSLSEIAREKAGIIKDRCDVVLYPQEQTVEMLFDEVCGQRAASLHKMDFSSLSPNSFLSASSFDGAIQSFDYGDYKALEISLLGRHQINNAAVAVQTIEILRKKGYRISDRDLRAGLKKAKWPGRFEIVNHSPVVVIDGAHNAEGAKALADNLKSYYPHRKITFVCGVLADKDYREMMKPLFPLAYRFAAVTPENRRALRAETLASFLNSYHSNVMTGRTIRDTVSHCLNTASREEVICVFGSLYYIGEVREYFGLA